jgi:hypothetical protein
MTFLMNTSETKKFSRFFARIFDFLNLFCFNYPELIFIFYKKGFLNSHAVRSRVKFTRLRYDHRYLMSRLSLQVFYLWRIMYCIVDSAAIYIMVVIFRNNICSPSHRSSPFLGGLRCQSIQTEHSPYTYSRKNPKSSLYCEMSMGLWCMSTMETQRIIPYNVGQWFFPFKSQTMVVAITH